MLTLWNDPLSATRWSPSETVLLITSPGYNAERKRLSVSFSTFLEVNPSMYDAEWLRDYASKRLRREHANPPFPGIFDTVGFTSSPKRPLFTLGDAAEIARGMPKEPIMGFFSLGITEIQISQLHQRGMLCSAECCGVPVHANTHATTCKNCDRIIALRPNPRLVRYLGVFCLSSQSDRRRLAS